MTLRQKKAIEEYTIYKPIGPIEALFDSIQGVVFFIKDAAGKYTIVNETLVRRSGAKHKTDLLGRTPSEVLGSSLGVSYEKQDRAVLKTGEPIVHQLELHIYQNRTIGWCITTKHACFDEAGAIVGLAGISQDLRQPDFAHEDYAQLRSAIEYAEKHLSDPPDIATVSTRAGMSPFQLDRRMRRIFGLSTGQWILKQRLDLAQRLLLETDASIIQVALETGYSDQSAFSRQFARATGLSPAMFRKTQGS